MNPIRRLLYPIPLLALLMTGCSTENISDRLYTQSIGIGGGQRITLHGLAFDETMPFSGSGASAAEALAHAEAQQGGRIFLGHTELLCLDGSRTLESCRRLLTEQGLSPACKVICADLPDVFGEGRSEALLQSVRMAEKNGLLAVTDLSTVLDEWLGQKQTALLPAVTGDAEGMVLLHEDGTRTALSEEAVRGLFWLRPHGSEPVNVTLGSADITVLQCHLDTDVEIQADVLTLVYSLTVRSEDCPSSLRTTAAAHILQQCTAAAEEMLAADADVIGMETLLAAHGIKDMPSRLRIRTEVMVQ